MGGCPLDTRESYPSPPNGAIPKQLPRACLPPAGNCPWPQTVGFRSCATRDVGTAAGNISATHPYPCRLGSTARFAYTLPHPPSATTDPPGGKQHSGFGACRQAPHLSVLATLCLRLACRQAPTTNTETVLTKSNSRTILDEKQLADPRPPLPPPDGRTIGATTRHRVGKPRPPAKLLRSADALLDFLDAASYAEPHFNAVRF